MAQCVKNPPANEGAAGDPGSIPGSGRSPGGGHGSPLQYSCLENPMDRGAWRAIVYGVAECRTRLIRLNTYTHDSPLILLHPSSEGERGSERRNDFTQTTELVRVRPIDLVGSPLTGRQGGVAGGACAGSGNQELAASSSGSAEPFLENSLQYLPQCRDTMPGMYLLSSEVHPITPC